MRSISIKSKRQTASIRLPKPKTNKRVKPATRKTVTRTSANSVSSAARRPAMSRPRACESCEPKVSFHILQGERMLFLVLLMLIIVMSSIYVGVKFQARSAGFEMGDLKQTQLDYMKEREELMKQITTHKRPEVIEKRARQRGMILPTGQQVIRLP